IVLDDPHGQRPPEKRAERRAGAGFHADTALAPDARQMEGDVLARQAVDRRRVQRPERVEQIPAHLAVALGAEPALILALAIGLRRAARFEIFVDPPAQAEPGLFSPVAARAPPGLSPP